MKKLSLFFVVVISLVFTVLLSLSACGPAKYTLDTAVSPEGSGTVAPDGGTYDTGTAVPVVAAPATGYAFDCWSGDATGTTSSVAVSMDGDKSVIAHFKIAQYSLSVSVNPDGAGSVHVYPGCCIYTGGTEVFLGGLAGEGYAFDHWSGDASGTDEHISIIMDRDKNIVANFRESHTGLFSEIGCCARSALEAQLLVQNTLNKLNDAKLYYVGFPRNAKAGTPKLVTLDGVQVWEVPVLENGLQRRGEVYVRLQ